MMQGTKNEKLNFLYDMIQCSVPMLHWVYNTSQEVISGPEGWKALQKVFVSTGCCEYMTEYGKKHNSPLILSAPLGLLWAASYEKDDEELKRLHVMGPVKAAEVSPNLVEELIGKQYTAVQLHRMLVEEMNALPVVPSSQFFQYALMQHYCLTGERLSISNLHYQKRNFADVDKWGSKEKRDRKNTYMAEQELLYMVRTGDLNYRASLDKASNLSVGIHMDVGDPLRQAKNSVIVFTSLCARAAIKGGLSTDTSYSRGDAYIQSIEECTTISEVSGISHMMYEDFIGLVNRQRMHQLYSREIRDVCEYIRFHVMDPIQIHELAQLAGYSDYYLSRKFKKEVNMSILEYIRTAKLSKAKQMLESTDDTVQEICDKLHFSSRGHFTEQFRKEVGCSPNEYRQRERK